MNKTAVIAVTVVLLGIVGVLVVRSMPPASSQETINVQPTTNSASGTQKTGMESSDSGDAMKAEGNVVEVAVTGSPFKFDPATITVKKGDTVRVKFANIAGMHDWVIDEFNARTKVLTEVDATETIEFVAGIAGSFEYYCSVGNHRAMGMKGKLVVTE